MIKARIAALQENASAAASATPSPDPAEPAPKPATLAVSSPSPANPTRARSISNTSSSSNLSTRPNRPFGGVGLPGLGVPPTSSSSPSSYKPGARPRISSTSSFDGLPDLMLPKVENGSPSTSLTAPSSPRITLNGGLEGESRPMTPKSPRSSREEIVALFPGRTASPGAGVKMGEGALAEPVRSGAGGVGPPPTIPNKPATLLPSMAATSSASPATPPPLKPKPPIVALKPSAASSTHKTSSATSTSTPSRNRRDNLISFSPAGPFSSSSNDSSRPISLSTLPPPPTRKSSLPPPALPNRPSAATTLKPSQPSSVSSLLSSPGPTPLSAAPKPAPLSSTPLTSSSSSSSAPALPASRPSDAPPLPQRKPTLPRPPSPTGSVRSLPPSSGYTPRLASLSSSASTRRPPPSVPGSTTINSTSLARDHSLQLPPPPKQLPPKPTNLNSSKPTIPRKPPAVASSFSPARPSSAPSSASSSRSRYSSLFTKLIALRRAAAMKALLLGRPAPSSTTASEEGGQDGEDLLDSVVIAAVWSRSKLEPTVLRGIWDEVCAGRGGDVEGLGREPFVKGMERIDDELRERRRKIGGS